MGKLAMVCGLVLLGVAFANSLRTELYSAAKDGDVAFVKQAISDGTDVNFKNSKSGSTALMAASFNNQVEVVRLLLDAGAIVDEVDIAGQTALYFAASTGSTDVVPILIAHGANTSAQTISGSTVALAASLRNNLSILKMVINAGANVNLAQNDGMTPLHYAAQDNRMDVAKELLKAGANAHAIAILEDYDDYEDTMEMTPFELARENRHTQLADFIKGFTIVNTNTPTAASRTQQVTTTTASDSHLALLMKGIGRALWLTYAVVRFFACIIFS